jgi:F-type H+-transporting ATPase subunit delta
VPDRRRAWAHALFLAAPDREARAAYAEALEALAAAVEGEKGLRELLADPSAPKEAKASILAASLGSAAQGETQAVFGRFCSLLVEKGRAALLAPIARAYCAMREKDEGIARLEVESAREVDPEALDRIAKAWTAFAGAKTTRTSVRVSPELIAGYRLRAGSLRIDYSVAGRLERLRRELAQPLGKSPAQSGGSGGAARGEG